MSSSLCPAVFVRMALELQAPVACLSVRLLCEEGILRAGLQHPSYSPCKPLLPLVMVASTAVLWTVSYFQRRLGKNKQGKT